MNKSDIRRNLYMLKGPLAKKGYDWWWHNFTGINHRTGKERTFFIEYYICNPALGGDKAILGQNPENLEKKIKPSYAMIKAGTWGEGAKQIHNFYPVSGFSSDGDSLHIRIGSCTLSENHMKGRCVLLPEEASAHPEYMCDHGEMSWDLSINKKIAYNAGYGASPFFRGLNAFEMFWHAEGMKSEYSGSVILDGEVYDVLPERSYGYADKNWGSDFTSPWLWIGCSCMKSLITGKALANSAIDIGGGRPKIFGIALDRKILIGMFYEGKMHEFNFSKFWKMSKVNFDFTEGETEHTWKVNAVSRSSALELTLSCRKNEMLLINYESPNGKKLHNRLWNGGTGSGEMKLYCGKGKNRKLIDHIELKYAGCEYGEYSPGTR